MVMEHDRRMHRRSATVTFTEERPQATRYDDYTSWIDNRDATVNLMSWWMAATCGDWKPSGSQEFDRLITSENATKLETMSIIENIQSNFT